MRWQRSITRKTCSIHDQSCHRSKGQEPGANHKAPRQRCLPARFVSSWQIKTGRTFQITHLPSNKSSNSLAVSLPRPDNIAMAILHNIFVEGAQLSFELEEKDLEASKLYPDYNYTSVDSLLDICLVNPPNPKLASFA
ncbi:unnamed protein product [Thlaspi arvense]|uniref:Uncharacterized protein n=1 Tax=Thlaspi arvense TaxID=13288 RepID=A0AAU9TCF9_THLAR|nr:unnamed protein product [Thlaspi arvense]